MANQNPNVRTAFDFFMSRAYSQAQTAGIIGNLLGESNLNPNGPNGDGGVARDIAQWHPDRWGVHLSRSKAMGRDPATFTPNSTSWTGNSAIRKRQHSTAS